MFLQQSGWEGGVYKLQMTFPEGQCVLRYPRQLVAETLGRLSHKAAQV